MTVDVKRKCGRGVANVSLYRFDVIAILEQNRSESMSHIVEASFWNSNRIHDFLEMFVHGMVAEMSADLVGEDQAPFIFPKTAGTKTRFVLLKALLTENVHHEGRRGDSTNFIGFATDEAVFSAFLFFFLKLL